jgi:hypothetical protein
VRGISLEAIIEEGRTLAYLMRAGAVPRETTFVTPPEERFQVGFIVHEGGTSIARHVHRPLQRHLIGTSEVLVVQSGRCEVDFFGERRELVATREMFAGDVMIMIAGGHGFRLLEDTVFLEIKQGPYTGLDEKERF